MVNRNRAYHSLFILGVVLLIHSRVFIFLFYLGSLIAQDIQTIPERSLTSQITQWDYSISHHLQGDNSRPILDISMETWALGTPAFEIGTALTLLSMNQTNEGMHLSLSLISTGLTAMGLKYSLQRERPKRQYKPRMWNTRITPSFPSGHTASFATYAAFMSNTYPETTPVMVAMTLLTGYSQIYVGNHYLGDVLAGAVIGCVVGTYFANQ